MEIFGISPLYVWTGAEMHTIATTFVNIVRIVRIETKALKKLEDKKQRINQE